MTRCTACHGLGRLPMDHVSRRFAAMAVRLGMESEVRLPAPCSVCKGTGYLLSEPPEPIPTEDPLIAKAREEVARAWRSGELSEEHVKKLDRILVDFGDAVSKPVRTREEADAQNAAMEEVLTGEQELFDVESPADLPPRAEVVHELLKNIDGYMFTEIKAELKRSKPDRPENQRFEKLAMDLKFAMHQLRQAADDRQTRRIERLQLRPLAASIRKFGVRNHIMVARPFWGASDVEANPASIFFAGGQSVESYLRECCKARDLRLKTAVDRRGTGAARWDLLRECVVGVFDLTMISRRERASVCHALGVGLARGICPVVLAARGGEKLPFDIDVDVRYIRTTNLRHLKADGSTIGDALDEAVFGLHRTSGEKASIRETAAQCTATGDCKDPIELERRLKQALDRERGHPRTILHPVWPPAYPESDRASCFHIMPFREKWSGKIRDRVRHAVDASGMQYSRGDMTRTVQVIRSIWDEICRASAVVIDLTGLNPNVCLELGLAQAVGRPTLLLSQDNPRCFFPEIAKLQVRRYKADGSGIDEIVGAWLKDL